MKAFYQLLANSLLAAAKNNFVWFALTYWAYLETQSVVATGLVGGTFMVVMAVTSMWMGSLVDHHKKKSVLIGASLVTLAFFVLGLVMLLVTPESAFTSVTSPALWLFMIVLLVGTIAGGVYNIAVPTLVTVLVPEKERDKANGMFGTVMGISFAITSVASGLVLGYAGMNWVMITAVVLTLVSIVHLLTISIPEKHIVHTQQEQSSKKWM